MFFKAVFSKREILQPRYICRRGSHLKQLFKYLREPRNLFTEGFIRLSQPAALNDPFEASFCIESLNELASHFDDSEAYDFEYGNISFSQYIEMRMHNIGVISLSENKENLLMWAHYADEHKGIVAGISHMPMFDSIFQNLFRADTLINTSWGEEYSPFDGKPKPISYRKGLRYRSDKFDYDYSNISVEGADRLLYEVFMQKSDEWIYEQEHRVVLRLEQADRVIIEDVEKIKNSVIKDRIKSANYSQINLRNNSYTVDLYKIQDDAIRVSVAKELAKLSHNSNIIYLMLLNPSCINNCLLGLKSSLQKVAVQGQFACSVGCLDIWQAKKNNDYYSLEFTQI
jgi:hypothetical protein